MVRDQLVTRDRSEKDRRYYELSITEDGNRLRDLSRSAHEARME
jgi:DNA-binding MarR family transcriptional regulator